jgi:hypothetical protein
LDESVSAALNTFTAPAGRAVAAVRRVVPLVFPGFSSGKTEGRLF